MIIRAVLDAQMNQTLSHITVSVPDCTTFLLHSGDMLLYCHSLVVVEVPSTCQDSNLAGKRGASQGSPLRVAPGVPLGMGGDPEPCTERYWSTTSV